MASRNPGSVPSERLIQIARDVSEALQDQIITSDSKTPMLDFVSTAGLVHAYVLGFAISEGAKEEDVLAAAEKQLRIMTKAFINKRTPT